MSDQDRIKSILAEYQQAVDAAQSAVQAAAAAAESKQRELVEAHPDLADELQKHFSDGHARDIDATVTFGKSESDTANYAPAISDDTLPRQQSAAPSTESRQFGDYELLGEIASGGMGVVYKARQVGLDRIVALKMIRTGGLADKTDVDRFRTEAQAAAKLKHPGILPVFDVGAVRNQPYFTMELAGGGSLMDRLRDDVLPPREAAEVVTKIAAAIQHAHDKDILHRDLKPGNILLDSDGEPKVADFGLAKRMDADAGHTVTGAAVGTPSYMPPEQAEGKLEEMGVTADVYSLGAVLYCLLTGRPPFRAATHVDTLRQVIDQEAVAPRKLNQSIPRDLETICLKSLNKEPNKRYPTAADLADDLGCWLNSEPIKARRVGQLEKSFLWCKRRPAVAGMIAAVVLVSVIAGVSVSVARHKNTVNRVKTAISNLSGVRGELVEYLISDLNEDFPKQMVRAELRSQYAAASHSQKLGLAYALADYGEPDLKFLLASISDAPANECANFVNAFDNDKESALKRLTELAKEADAKKNWKLKGRLAVVALHLGDASLAVDVHKDRSDPTQQTVFIHDAFASWHGELQRLAERLRAVDDGPLRAGICLAMGNLPVDEVGNAKSAWQQLITKWYLQSPDSGTHSAAGWALRQWNSKLPDIATNPSHPTGRNWKVTRHGFTMVRIPPGQFERTEFHKDPKTQLATVRTKQAVTLTRNLWLSDVEVTVGEFEQFMNDETYRGLKPKNWNGVNTKVSITSDHPVQQTSWEDAVLFCNWLSQQEGHQPCYKVEPIPNRSTFLVQRLPDGGYRLPTEAEWEYACRAGTTTDFGFGNDRNRLSSYAVFESRQTEVPASKMCNRWGLFDTHGNVFEWCQDWHQAYQDENVTDPYGPSSGLYRVNRGGCWSLFSRLCQSGQRVSHAPTARSSNFGFRVAQVPLPVKKTASGVKRDSR